MVDLEKEAASFIGACFEPEISQLFEYEKESNSFQPIKLVGGNAFVQLNLVNAVFTAWECWQKCAASKQAEIDALKAQVAEHKSQQVLTLTKIYNCLHKANSEGVINDTIWLSNHETLFDFISSEILNCGGKVEVR